MAACEKHTQSPYVGYSQCPGCECERLAAEKEALWETLLKIGDALDIDYEEARKEDGKPSDVYIRHIKALEATIEQLEAQVEQLGEMTGND
ncbi:hypothetical protein [Halomonas sp. BMC6]|uniref:hypothetical protein n=1 Tax=Halomonas sp. BMC6 TaxID=3073244 RepID=UPI0030D47FD8